jgi:hypothetical protein
MWTAPHVIRLTTITLRHFDAGERAPSTTPKGDIAAWHDCKRLKLKKLAPVPLKKVPLDDLERKVASLSLHLDRSPVLLGGPGGDH